MQTLPNLPKEADGSHYYAARVAGANSVQMITGTSPVETEKFLFYRGVGRFTAPLEVRLQNADTTALQLTNQGAEPLGELFVYEVRGDMARFVVSPALAPAAARTCHFVEPVRPLPEVRAELARRMRAALVSAGLYEAEAAAMIATWEDSWFAEPGLRVLYLLPRAWTDRTLLLTLVPAPREIARVMVGRAELITPQNERDLHAQIIQFRGGSDEARRAEAVRAARATGLGRFAEPTVRRLCALDAEDRDFGNAAWELLSTAFGPQAALAK